MRYEGNWILDNSQLAFNENDLQCEEDFILKNISIHKENMFM